MLYHSLQEEANELADLQLRQLAAALPGEFAAGSGLPATQHPEEEYIADHHSAEIDLADNPAGGGLVVMVRFP